jgi:hypothetical protein
MNSISSVIDLDSSPQPSTLENGERGINNAAGDECFFFLHRSGDQCLTLKLRLRFLVFISVCNVSKSKLVRYKCTKFDSLVSNRHFHLGKKKAHTHTLDKK